MIFLFYFIFIFALDKFFQAVDCFVASVRSLFGTVLKSMVEHRIYFVCGLYQSRLRDSL